MNLTRPKISLLAKTNLDQNSFHSILISLLRGLAAIEVAAAHVRAQTLPSLRSLHDPNIWYQGLSFFTGFAHQAVVVFFLLSGWLVGGSLLNKLKTPNVILFYFIDRITRLWIVLIPSFFATICFAMLQGTIDTAGFDHSPSNKYSALSFFGNLFGLQNIAVPEFGGNFPLWSLSYETWYYVLFPLALMSFFGKKITTRIGALIVTLTLATNLSIVLLLYLSIWILGAAFSRIKIDVSKQMRMILLAIFLATSVYFRLTGKNDNFTNESFPQDLLLSFTFMLLLASQQRPVDFDSRTVRASKTIGKFFADFSFSLYVFHVPILGLLIHFNKTIFGIEGLSPDRPLHYAIYFSILMAIVSFSYLFYLFFEAHTYKLRRRIKQILNNSPRITTVDSAPEAKQ